MRGGLFSPLLLVVGLLVISTLNHLALHVGFYKATRASSCIR